MPPPTEYTVSDAFVAPLLARATIDAHKFMESSVRGRKKERGLAVPYRFFVLFLNETTEQYEAAFVQGTKSHSEAIRQRRIEWTLQWRVRGSYWVIIYLLLLHATLLPRVRWDLVERVQLVCLLVSGNQTRHVDTQRVNRLLRVKTLGVPFSLDKDLKLQIPPPGDN